jgi:hypothetical protein
MGAMSERLLKRFDDIYHSTLCWFCIKQAEGFGADITLGRYYGERE